MLEVKYKRRRLTFQFFLAANVIPFLTNVLSKKRIKNRQLLQITNFLTWLTFPRGLFIINLFYFVNKFIEGLFMTIQLSLKGKHFSLYTCSLNVMLAFHSCVGTDIISRTLIGIYGCIGQNHLCKKLKISNIFHSVDSTRKRSYLVTINIP